MGQVAGTGVGPSWLPSRGPDLSLLYVFGGQEIV